VTDDPAWLPPLAIAFVLAVGTWAALPYLSDLLAGARPSATDRDAVDSGVADWFMPGTRRGVE
jgi:hypothetical protein